MALFGHFGSNPDHPHTSLGAPSFFFGSSAVVRSRRKQPFRLNNAITPMQPRGLHHFAALTALILVSIHANAQSLSPPAKTVFRCEEGGKVVYSDAPCLGARKIDVEPTRGVSKLSGKERIGSAVQHERQREQIAEAVRPLSGMNPQQFDTFGRRQNLSSAAQRECLRLDEQVMAAERDEHGAKGPVLAEIQARLFGLRKRFRELGC